LLTQRQLPGALGDHLGIEALETLAVLQDLLHTEPRMLPQQFQDTHIVTPAQQRAVSCFQAFTHFLENRRQLPLAIDVGMIQGSRPTRERRQVMQRVEHLAAGQVTAFVPGHHLAAHDDLDVLGVSFHGGRPKGITLRHAVTHLIETRCLVFVDLGLLVNAGLKARGRQRPGFVAVAFETLADGLGVVTGCAFAVYKARGTQVAVELGHILLLGHGRGPTPLQRLDAVLHVGLLIATCRHTKQRLEDVVAGQGLVTRMQLPLPAAENRRRHRLGIVPPNFARHTAEELEALHHPFQNRFGSFAR